MDETSTVVKKGEIVTQVTLARSIKVGKMGLGGLSITVKVHPGIEEFAKALGNGDKRDVKSYGRHWAQIDQPLFIYDHDPGLVKLETLKAEDGTQFHIGFPGGPMYIEGSAILNVSFLRLVGISEGAGVTFGVAGVYTLDSMRTFRDKISSACRKYYEHFLRPVSLAVTVSTQELQF